MSAADVTKPGETDLAAAVRDLSTLVADLSERVHHLETALAERPAAAGSPADEGVPPEVVLAISAAVAAYLGKRATVKQVRLRRGSAWGAAGRTAIQQSHQITHHAR